MPHVKIGPLGIRGQVDQGLDLSYVLDLCSALATWLEAGPIVVGRDTRPSSPMLVRAVCAALSAAGREVLDAGIVPTAVAQAEAARQGAAGILSITASHNDAGWNGLKLYGPAGRVLSSAEGHEILDLWHQGEWTKVPCEQLGAVHVLDGVLPHYLDRLLADIDQPSIAAAGLRVVIDACNGAGAMVVPALCRRLGVELIPLSCEPSGIFPHAPDPTRENMAQAAAIMAPVRAHVGFGLSSDCERLSLITERGVALGTGATLPLIAEHVLASQPPGATLIASIASDSRVDEVARRHSARVVRSGVGIQAVAEQMELEQALLGGENSGGVALGTRPCAFDGLAVMVQLLQRVAQLGGAQPLADELPRVHVRSAAVPYPLSGAYAAVARVREQARGKVTDLDGVHVALTEGWYYVRVSNTEPIIRVICEAPSAEAADELLRSTERQVRLLAEP